MPVRPDSCGEYATKFPVFRDYWGYYVGGDQEALHDYFKPDRRFVEFLKHDFQFVNEISAALGAARLPIVSGCRGSGSEDLPANMPTLRRTRQACRQRNNRSGKSN